MGEIVVLASPPSRPCFASAAHQSLHRPFAGRGSSRGTVERVTHPPLSSKDRLARLMCWDWRSAVREARYRFNAAVDKMPNDLLVNWKRQRPFTS